MRHCGASGARSAQLRKPILLWRRAELAEVVHFFAEDFDLLLERFAIDADAFENLALDD